MTGTDLLAYILKVFKRTDKDTEVYEAITDIVADIKYNTKLEAVKEEAYIVGISTLGDYRIALPNDFQNLIGDITVIEPNDNTRRLLNKISKEVYDERYSTRLFSSYSDMTSGLPEDYCIYAGQIYLGPVPDDVDYKYQINYTTKDTTAITSSTTSVPFTSSYKERNVVRAGVLAEMFSLVEDYEESNYWRALYTIGKSEMVDKDNENISDNVNITYHSI